MADEWTPSLLKALMDQRFADNEKALVATLASVERKAASELLATKEAVLKAELANERRFESVNEFRGTLSDQQRLLIPRQEVTVEFSNLREKIDGVSTRLEALAIQVGNQRSEGIGMTRFLGYIVTAVVLLGGILAIVFRFVGN